MIETTETIAAIATSAGVGGVGIVRLSGPDAVAIAEAVVGVKLDRRVRVASARDGTGAVVDQVLAFAMRGPRSFTGEDVAELQGHGGGHNLQRLLAVVLAHGARIAEPGEFTRRAVANGKLDLARAEALLEVIHAGSERAWRQAQANLDGRLGSAAAELERRLLLVLAELEGHIDFPDDDLGETDAAWVDAELAAIGAACAKLAAGFRQARAVADGVTVALVGPVNVGKSSLLNALVGKERALVAASPGTTRDYVEATAEWDGVAVTVIDTAGLRETADEVERRGIELGASRVDAADVVVVVNDGVSEWDRGARFGARAVVVRSKVDIDAPALPRRSKPSSLSDITSSAVISAAAISAAIESDAIATSAVTGEGLDDLKRAVLAKAGIANREGSEDAVVTTARQHAAVETARAAVERAAVTRATAVIEVTALELREATRALAEVRGVEVGERVLDEVFARFCIGK